MRAATYTWTGGGADGNWNTVANWRNGLPASNQSTALIFGGSSQLNSNQNLGSAFSLNSLAFDSSAGAYVLSGGRLDFSTNSASALPTLTQNSAALVAINNGFRINSALTVVGTGSLTLGGVVENNAGITMAGTGTLTLTGNNNNAFGGSLTLQAGTVNAGSAAALGNGSGTISFTGGTLQYSAANSTDYSLRFDKTTANQSFKIDTNGQSVTLATGLTSSGGTLTKLGAGTLTLNGAGAYTGVTTVNAGTLVLNDGTNSAIVVNNAAGLQVRAATTVTSAAGLNGSTQNDAGGDAGPAVTLNGTASLANTGSLVGGVGGGGYQGGGKGGAAVTLNGNSAFTNNATLTGGEGGNGSYNTSGSGGTGLNLNDSSAATNNATITGGGGGAAYSQASLGGFAGAGGAGVALSGVGTLTNNGNVIGGVGGVAGASTFSGNIGDMGPSGGTAGSANSGTLINFGTLTGGLGGRGGNGDYGGRGGTGGAGASVGTGGTLLNVGVINGGNGGAGGTGSAPPFPGGGSPNGSGGNTGTGVVFSGAAGTLVNQRGGTINNGVTAGNFAGTVTLQIGSAINGGLNLGTNSGATLFLTDDGTAGSQVYSAAVNGGTTFGGALAKTGSGTWFIDQTLGTTAGTTVSGGVLQVGVGGTSGGLGSGNIVNGTQLVFNRSDNVALANAISGSGVLTQAGPGTLSLTGPNSYVGATLVRGGVLQAGSANSPFGSSPTVDLSNLAGVALDLNGFNLTLGSLSGGGASGGNVWLGSGNLTVGNTGNATFGGSITGTGSVTKVGTGTLNLTGTSTFTGSVNVNAGVLSAVAESSLGGGSMVTLANGSQLVFTGSTSLTRTYNLGVATLAAGGGTSLTFAGATVNGGTLAGPGADILANGSTFNNTRAGSGTNFSQTGGTVAFNNVTLSGNSTFTQATGAILNTTNDFITTPQTTLTVNGAFSTQGGSISGGLTINNGGVVTSGGGAAAPLYLDGSRGTTVNAGGQLIAASGSTVELGGLLVNNGAQTGTLNVNLGGVARGSGTFGTVNVGNGGRFGVNTLATGGGRPNNLAVIPLAGADGLAQTAFVGPLLAATPGKSFVTSLALGSGSMFAFSVQDAANTNGNGYDTVSASGALTLAAGTTVGNQITVTVTSLSGNGTAGPAGNFDPSKNYAFVLVAAGGGITGFDPGEFIVDASGFQNGTNGGSFSVVQQGNDLDLLFTSAVPEPGTWTLLGLGACGLLLVLRRRARQTAI